MACIERRGFLFGICYLLFMSYFLISHLYAAESVITDSEGYACRNGGNGVRLRYLGIDWPPLFG
jgi:hypothetical protein